MKHDPSARRTAAFYLETLLLTLFLLALLAVLVQVFGAARALGVQAREQTAATNIAENVAAGFSAGQAELDRSDGTARLRYNAAGAADPAGEYLALVSFSARPAGTGQMLCAEISVSRADAGAAPLAQQTTERYQPGG